MASLKNIILCNVKVHGGGFIGMGVQSYSEASAYLGFIFDELNEKYFNNELEPIVITIMTSLKAYGHYVLRDDVWLIKNTGYGEINIGAEWITRPIENVISTLVHEMVHYYCSTKGIKDTSARGMYHNKRFKIECEARGLIIAKHELYGWTLTTPSNELKQWINEKGFENIEIGRNEYSAAGNGNGKDGGLTDGDGKGKRKGSTRRYICGICGNSVRATKTVNIMCMDCGQKMETGE